MDGYSLVGETKHTQKNKRAKQNRLFRREAQATLLSGDNYYKSVLSHFTAVLMGGGFFYAAYLFAVYGTSYGIGDMSDRAVAVFIACVSVILCLIGAFFLFAFLLGAYTLSCGMNSGTEPDGLMHVSSMSKMLSPLASMRELKNTFIVFLILTFELFICSAPAVFVFNFIGQTGINGAAAVTVKAFTLVCSIFLGLFFVFLLLPYPYILQNSPGQSPIRTYASSAKAALCDIWLGYSMFFSFIFLLILSALTFGVLYFAYTMPYMTHSMAKVGEYLYKLSITERNDINET